MTESQGFLKRLWRSFTRIWADSLRLPVLAVLIGLALGAVIIWATGKDPLLAYSAMVKGVFGSPSAFGETIAYATPLILTGLAVSFAFRCGLFNIGAEGQVIMGMLVSGLVGIYMPGPGWLVASAAIAAGGVAGALWAAVPGILKATRGIHEVINSIMMNYIAMYVANYLIQGKFKAEGVQGTAQVKASARLLPILEPSQATIGIFVALACAGVIYFILWRTTFGYEVRAVGQNPNASRYAGINVVLNMVMAMVVSGALAGMGGALQTMGPRGRVFTFFASPGYGFDGIAVALIGRNHPIGVVFAAFLFGALSKSGLDMMMTAQVPKQVIAIIQAAIIFLVAADQIIAWLFRLRKKEAAE
jgi:simple sugar transport system permease protein